MTDLLRRELQRLGDEARPVSVPPDTWRRGRRARLRDRGLVAGAAALVLALVAGTAWAVLDVGRTPPVDERSDDGVPSRIYAVPERLTGSPELDDTWPSGMESDLATGRGAIAFVAGGAVPVVVTAADGAYHRLLLPDVDYGDSARATSWGEGRWLTLSPDGRYLAYARPTAAPDPFGIGIVDLQTGTVRRIAIGTPQELDVVSWSPDGRWLGWSGRSPDGQATGRTDLSEGGQVESIVGAAVPAVAMADDGAVHYVTRSRHLVMTDDSPARVAMRGRFTDEIDETGAVSPDGGWVVVGSAGRSTNFVSLDDGVATSLRLPQVPGQASVTALGWVDKEYAAVLVTRAGPGTQEVALVTPDDQASPRYRTVVEVETGATSIRSVSVAVDLMSLDRPTIDRSAPDWPWSQARTLTVWGLGAVALALAAGLLLWTRRHRRLPRRTAGTS